MPAKALAQTDVPAMKDRSNIAALVLALEAVVISLAKVHVAKLDKTGREAFKTDVSGSLDLICHEVVTQAPVTGRGVSLAPAAAKATAMRLETDARELLAEYYADLFGAS